MQLGDNIGVGADRLADLTIDALDYDWIAR